MTTDYRTMCAELLEWAERTSSHYYKQADVIVRARALLDQPVAEGPTNETPWEINDDDFLLFSPANAMASQAQKRSRRGRPTPQPVALSERLPRPEDCNGDGDVWAWRRFDPEGDMDNGDFWCLAFCEWLEDEDCNFTHWLPANALPTPEPHAQ